MKLHLGCGTKHIPGFIHIDARPGANIDIVGPIEHLPQFEVGSVSQIYACHVLEHFPRHQVPEVLKEWFRVLKPHGTLRLSVPDFAAICNVYSSTLQLELVAGPILGRQDHEFNFHYSLFDESLLTGLLNNAGFREVQRYDWRTTEHAEIDDYSQAYIPHMDKERGVLISLNIEAKKPNGSTPNTKHRAS